MEFNRWPILTYCNFKKRYSLCTLSHWQYSGQIQLFFPIGFCNLWHFDKTIGKDTKMRAYCQEPSEAFKSERCGWSETDSSVSVCICAFLCCAPQAPQVMPTEFPSWLSFYKAPHNSMSNTLNHHSQVFLTISLKSPWHQFLARANVFIAHHTQVSQGSILISDSCS